MNYIREINAFEDKQKADQLKPLTQLLWYKLMAVNNDSRWTEWFCSGNRRLLADMNITSEKTLIMARNELIEKGYILYQSNAEKRLPGRYKIVATEETSLPDMPAALPEPPPPVPVIEEKPSEAEEIVEEIKTAELDLKVILDYYLLKALKDLESRNDINVAQFLMACEGMDMAAIQAGVDKSAKTYTPKYPGQRMPFVYCKPAIMDEVSKTKKGGAKEGVRAGKNEAYNRENTGAVPQKKYHADERTRRLVSGYKST